MIFPGEKFRQISIEDFPYTADMASQIGFLLQFAILAPSTHNIQPWRFRIQHDICEIYLDPSYDLPYTDSVNRDAYISIGCVLESLILVARYVGIYKKHEYTISSSVSDGVARIYFETQQPDHSLGSVVEAMLKRKNVRGVYAGTQVPKGIRQRIQEVSTPYNASLYQSFDAGHIEAVATYTKEGICQAYRQKMFRKEMSQYILPNTSKKPFGLHGYTLRMSLFASHVLPRLIRWVNMSPVLSKLNYKSISSAPLVCAFTHKEDTPYGWVQTGQLAMRVMLEYVHEQYDCSIYVASIEIGTIHEHIKTVFGMSHRPLFLFTVGKAEHTQPFSPRFSVKERLITSI